MNNDIKARYRNKLSKIIIEVWNGEKWIYVKTLSDPLKEFREECLAKVSFSTGENSQKVPQKFVHAPLTELSNKDTSKPVTIEEAQKELNKLMDEMLK